MTPSGHVIDLLSPYLEGDLPAQQQAGVETHLATCSSCQEDLERLKKVLELLRTMLLEEPPPGFLDRLHQRIEEGGWWRRLLRALFVPLSVKLPLQAFATVAVIGLAVFFYSSFEKHRGIPQGQEMRGPGALSPAIKLPLEALQETAQGAEHVLSPPRTYRVILPTVVRDQPTWTGKEIGQLPSNTTIEVLAITGDWLKVASADPAAPQGYIRQEDARPE